MKTPSTVFERQHMTMDELQAENAELRRRLEEAEETIRAIRSGAVDAFVVEESTGHRVYTLEGADRPYRLLVEQMKQGAAMLQTDGTIAYCNQRLADLLKMPHEKLIGAALHDFIATEDRSTYDNLLWQGQSRSGQGEARLQRTDGGLVPAYLTFNVLPKDCGAAIGVLVTDLTAQRHHEQLAAAHEALREAELRKDEFLAMLGHELRNPLAPIRNAVQVQRLKGSPDPDLQWSRDVIDRQLQQLTRLVDDLLDVSRISRGKIDLRMEAVDLGTVAARAIETSRPLIDARKHHLHVALPDLPVRVEGDTARLAQVVSNLLTNAAKYTEEGGRITLTVEAKGGNALIRVQDTGAGIAPDMLPHIFELFRQVQGSVSRSEGGLGIGLTLVRRLIEMHKGAVQAFSAGLGRGSEFVVRLPLLQEFSLPPAAEDKPPQYHKVPARRILIVDDNVDAALSLAMLLRLIGHEVQTAHNGPAALEAARSQPPDVVLLDIGLPGMSGLEVAPRLRQELGLRDTLLVALTGYGQEDDKRRSHEAGFNAHLVKPVDLDALHELLRRPQAIRGVRARAEPRP